MKPWVECPSLAIELTEPTGRRFGHVPREALEGGARLLRGLMNEVPPAARYLADIARVRTCGRFHAEAKAIARQVGIDWRSVMLGNLAYDLVLASMGCSTLALPTPSGPVLARNMDFWPEDLLAQTSYLLHNQRAGELVYANAAWPGSIGVVTGLSGRGFAVALNAVTGPERLSRLGYPVLLHIRRVMEDARDFEQAVHRLSRQRLTTPCLFTVVGRTNDQRVVIERTPTRWAHRRAEPDEPLVVTNDYRVLLPPATRPDHELYRTTCARYDNLRGFFVEHDASQEVTDEMLLYRLTDPGVIQSITAQHVIARPRRQTIRLFVPRPLLGQGSGCSTLLSE